MHKRARFYVGIVTVLAIGLAATVYAVAPSASSAERTAIMLLCGLALVAEALAFVLPNSATSSIAFIAYLAVALLSPSFFAVMAIALLRIVIELLQKRPLLKRTYNIAHYVANSAVAVLVYRAFGGVSLLAIENPTLTRTTTITGTATMAAFCASLAVSTILLVGVLSQSSGKSLAQVFRETKLPTLSVDLLAAPVVFLFAWVYAAHGPIAAVAAWVPVLGFRQLNKVNLDLEQMNEELLQLMVKSIEARDPYTSGHSRRVQEYAVTIARGLRLSERDVHRVSQAALLHDVGKINEKYHPILTKPDRLTAEEWAIMKEHPIDGANLVSTMTRLRHLIPSIRHHHENWDGTGYPDGIAGDLIPLEARIISVADTIDAMTSERPYRPGLSVDQVRAEIVRCRGKQFDPQVADRVLSSDVWSKLFPEAAVRADPEPLRLVKGVKVAV